MPQSLDLRTRIGTALVTLGSGGLDAGVRGLLDALGYRSPKTLDAPADPARFADAIGLDLAKLPHSDAWREIRFVFQLTGDELSALSRGWDPATGEAFQRGAFDSFVFLSLDGEGRDWTRGELVQTTRLINRAFSMPAILLFRVGDKATLAVIDRRPSARDAARDVVGGRVSLIKDIDLAAPHRAHLEILSDLSLAQLAARRKVGDFRGLYDAWLETLSAAELNKRFYDELVRWFAWAASEDGGVSFPKGQGKGEDATKVALIRLLTRLMFVWFVKEKGLVPAALFDRDRLAELLVEPPAATPGGHGYYLAILQNLFFATLNTEGARRGWRKDSARGSPDYLGHDRYRHEAMFRDSQAALDAFAPAPFLNGGLFQCLDTLVADDDPRRALAEPEGKTIVLRVDGFSDQETKQPRLPNRLFFGGAPSFDMSTWLGKRSRPGPVPGLIDLFERYKFTVEENTPLEEEAALDPELLGKVFENLLASYNVDTASTARAKSGSFYTPREVVDFMVDEALVAWLLPQMPRGQGERGMRAKAPGLDFGSSPGELALAPEAGPRIESAMAGEGATDPVDPNEHRLRAALSYAATAHDFSAAEVDAIVAAIERCRMIDPAVGSGAFPLGLLQKLVHLLGLLDPEGEQWRLRNRQRYLDQQESAEGLLSPTDRHEAMERADAALAGFDRAFSSGHYKDYTRKLFLIERCLYGVDVQPIAVQIAKLRCFISLAVSQRVDDAAENRGVTPLPNLETKFVAANTLTPLHRRGQGGLISGELIAATERLRTANRAFFAAANSRAKKAAQDRITGLRDEIAALVAREDVYPPDEARKLAEWNPFDPNASAPFFDAEWMFGLPPSADEGWFDLVLANPPYVRQEKIEGFTVAGKRVLAKADLKRDWPGAFAGKADLFVYFYERALTLLRPGGGLSFITSNKWYRVEYGTGLRRWLPERARILKLVDFGDAPVFEAIAYPTILVATRRSAANPPQANEMIQVLNWSRGWDQTRFAERVETNGFAMPQAALHSGGWQFRPKAERDLLKRLRQVGVPLGDWCGRRFYYGVKTGLNDAFVLNEAEHADLIFDPRHAEWMKPFLRGRDIKRWAVEPAGQWLIKIASSENEKHPWSGLPEKEAEQVFARTLPAIHAWFTERSRRATLIKRADQGHYFWELRSCAYWSAFEEPKVIVPAIVARGEAARDEAGFYCNNKATIFIPPSVDVATAIINSSVADWFARETFASKEGGFLDFEPRYSGTIPVPPANAAQSKTLATAALAAAAATTGAQRLRLEALVNAMVYELFFPEDAGGVFAAAEAAGFRGLESLSGDGLARAADDWSSHLTDPAHPLYAKLFDLQALDAVRIIEGR